MRRGLITTPKGGDTTDSRCSHGLERPLAVEKESPTAPRSHVINRVDISSKRYTEHINGERLGNIFKALRDDLLRVGTTRSIQTTQLFNTMPNVLESGIYEIHSHGTGNPVYRHPVEDRSGLPKPVFSLPPQVKPLGKVSTP